MYKSLFIFVVYLLFVCVRSTNAQSNSFVTRTGNQLFLNNKPFRFTGTNVHWLALREQSQFPPGEFAIDNVLLTAQEMGLNVVRTFGGTVGCPNCIWPNIRELNPQAFTGLDIAVKSASDKNIRLIVVLVDNHHYFIGGKHTFTGWRNIPEEDDFFTNPQVILDYKAFIADILNHVNPHTGLAYKDDPTIMAWETGNELGVRSGIWDSQWTADISTYIKSLAPRQLVIDGHGGGSFTSTGTIDPASLAIPTVDMYTSHYYPLYSTRMIQDAALVSQNNKVFFVGEYDWTDQAIVDGSISPENGTAKFNITTATTSPYYYYFVQLMQSGLSLTQGQSYTVSFRAKADIPHPLSISVVQGHSPYIGVFPDISSVPTFTVTPAWQTYSFSFIPNFSDPNMMISFNGAGAMGNLWLDDVFLATSGSSTNLIQNPSFATNLANWTPQVKPYADSLNQFLQTLETQALSGSLFWQLFGHDPGFGFAPGGDKFTLRYPGLNPHQQAVTQTIRSSAFRFQSLPLPSPVVRQNPLLYPPVYTPSGFNFFWRGSAGSASYNLWRQTTSDWELVRSELNESQQPLVVNHPSHAVYKIEAVNPDGLQSTNSLPVFSTLNLIRNPDFRHFESSNLIPFWRLETKESAQAKGETIFGEPNNSSSLQIDVQKSSPIIWHAQLLQPGLPLVQNQSYVLTFQAKASANHTFQAIFQKTISPYTEYHKQDFLLTPNWQTYRFLFTSSITNPDALLSFNFAKDIGQIWITNVNFIPFASPKQIILDYLKTNSPSDLNQDFKVNSVDFAQEKLTQ